MELGTSGLATWIQDNIVTLVLIIIAAGVLWAGNAGNISKVVTKVGLAIIGIIFLAIVVTGKYEDVGTWALGLFGIK